ncbi:MAG: DUF4405 domain-containing protein, partial [Lachnospiraceae bacterium]|nr:DUF4405 domain-containing protein [Lachnospiraceae bacterium]
MKKTVGIIVEILLYAIMVLQMLYVFLGNIPHEIMGIAFFILLVVHIIFKRKWIKALIKNGRNMTTPAKVNGAITLCMILVMIAMAVSAVGVSRTLFPWAGGLTSPDIHRYLATAMLALSVVHGGIHFYIRSKHKKRTVVIICLITALAIAFGLAGVPYINRHFRSVEIEYGEKVGGERVEMADKPLVVYFTRVGNT